MYDSKRVFDSQMAEAFPFNVDLLGVNTFHIELCLAASVFLVALLGWIIWAAFFKTPTASGSVSNFQRISNTVVEMTVSIDKPTDHAATCQVSAVTENQSSVGSKQISVAMDGVTTLNIRINTVQPAVDGVVELCAVK